MTRDEREAIVERAAKARESDPPYARVSLRKAEVMLDAVGFFDLIEAAEAAIRTEHDADRGREMARLHAAISRAKEGR